MTPRSRMVLVLAAVAVLIGGFLLAQGSGDDSSGSSSTTTPTVTTGAATTSGSATTAAPAVTTVVIKGGKPVGGVQDIKVAKGENVRFVVKSDVSDEIHVHGYDFHKDVTAGGQVAFDFPATIDGKFEIELENAGEQIISLTVTP